MLLYFTISNFRSIKESQTLSFEATSDSRLEDYFVVKKGKYRILKIATVLGANASGKSNVLKAFQLFPQLIFSPCENKTDKIKYSRFKLCPECQQTDSTLEIGFVCHEKKYDYKLRFNESSVNFEELRCTPFGELRSHKVFERTTDVELALSKVTLGDKYGQSSSSFKEMNVNLIQNRTVFGTYQKSNVRIDWMKEIVDWIEDYFMPVITPTTDLSDFATKLIDDGKIGKAQIVDMIQNADVGISDVVLKKTKETIPENVVKRILESKEVPEKLKKHIKEDPTTNTIEVNLVHCGEAENIPFEWDEESLGTQRYYGLAGIMLLLANENHFLCVDELESSMHPDLYEHFVVTYLTNAKESQIVFTTHMREFLADSDLFRDDSIWITEKSATGATELYSIADYGTDVLRKGTNRLNAYKTGKLGGIPHTGDTSVLKFEKES